MDDILLSKHEFKQFEIAIKEDIAEIKSNQKEIASIVMDTKALIARIDSLKERHDLCSKLNSQVHKDLEAELKSKVSFFHVIIFNSVLALLITIIFKLLEKS